MGLSADEHRLRTPRDRGMEGHSNRKKKRNLIKRLLSFWKKTHRISKIRFTEDLHDRIISFLY